MALPRLVTPTLVTPLKICQSKETISEAIKHVTSNWIGPESPVSILLAHKFTIHLAQNLGYSCEKKFLIRRIIAVFEDLTFWHALVSLRATVIWFVLESGMKSVRKYTEYINGNDETLCVCVHSDQITDFLRCVEPIHLTADFDDLTFRSSSLFWRTWWKGDSKFLRFIEGLWCEWECQISVPLFGVHLRWSERHRHLQEMHTQLRLWCSYEHINWNWLNWNGRTDGP